MCKEKHQEAREKVHEARQMKVRYDDPRDVLCKAR
jgi:hypothetical protein